ncbi:iron-sulfur cluster assembly accessory protein [filamentous cyanobacterium CCP1]|nr:iron-sulfur cluster assembly accessory protein [filamentous cyanobacterium CCP2]PSB67738.1 iron-sulfur cluster assembly accessory protein [filamentous cyanobacterium CCP1]
MIHLSQAAIAEVNRIKSKRAQPEALFRLGIQAGGCADFYYTLELDETPIAEDCVITCGAVQVVVSSDSLKHLDGLTVDYTEDLMGGGFRFHNPNASSTCGCGNSFSV